MVRIARRGSRLVLCTALAAAGAALSGCYVSHRLLLDPGSAAQPLADGVYARPDGKDRWRVQRELDGWYDVERYNDNGTIGETRRVLFNEMPLGALEAYAAAEQTDRGYLYAVLIKSPRGVFLGIPDCADPLDASVARDHGGRLEDDDEPSHNCTFTGRGGLIAALGDFAAEADLGAPYALQPPSGS